MTIRFEIPASQTVMTKPRRQHGAVRQLGAINKILRAEPQARNGGLESDRGSRLNAPYDRNQESRGRVHKSRASHQQQGARYTAHNIAEQTQPYQSTKLQNRMSRDGEPQHVSPAGRFSQGLHLCGAQPHLHSPQQERPLISGNLQPTQVPKPDEYGIKSSPGLKASFKDNNANRLGSEKRKRSSVGDGDEEQCDQSSKKHQTVRPNVLQLKQQVQRLPAVRSSSPTKATAVLTTLTIKCPGQTARKLYTQQPSPPSSSDTPEPENHTKDLKGVTIVESRNTTPSKSVESLSEQRTPSRPKTTTALGKGRKVIAVKGLRWKSMPAASKQAAPPPLPADTPNTARRTQVLEATLPSPIASRTAPQRQKRQRDDTDDVEPVHKRLRQARSASSLLPLPAKDRSPAEGVHRAIPGSTKIPTKHRTSRQKPKPRSVPPEDSFAPVTLNPECDFKILDYDNESVPVLYSVLIHHSKNSELLNRPPEELVFDALDAIEAGFKPFSKYGWPTAIDLLGRTPSTENPTKVLNDVDLYLHEKDGKLYVATDMGLVIVAEYLKLIGIPETQPIRFDGRIPPWAKVALRAREKRKVVEVFGKIREIQKVNESKDPDEPESALRDVEAAGQGAKKAEATEVCHSAQGTNKNVEYREILKAERPGHLPLPLGSSVIVYKIDHDDQWAYGRSYDSGEKGWFPISHTCPVDWSLDRFSGSSAELLDKPLPKSRDPEEKDWNGLVDYIRQQGFPEGPTWKQTCAATASTAVRTRAISKAIADLNTTRSCNANTSTPRETVTQEAIKTPIRQPRRKVAETHVVRNGDPPIESLREAPTKAAIEDPPSTAMDVSANKARIDVSGSKTEEQTGDVDTELVDKQHIPQPAPGVLEAPVHVDITLEAVQEAVGEIGTGTTTMLGKEEQEFACGSATHQSETLTLQEDNKSVPAASPRNPFTVPRYDPFERNDDIEYDWDDSGDEVL
ncbi:hypothetical protein N0V95_005005 [Ascochyta clinopodiicola]|nr:hypothetical protein N0V95_005005 [Ascochyta clinopodiicola]